MLRQFFTAQRNRQNSGTWTLGLLIIGVLALVSFLTTDIAPAATLVRHGTVGNLPQVWAADDWQVEASCPFMAQ